MMAIITNFLTAEWANAFGWTLFHSLWQSLLIVLIVKVWLHRIPVVRSGLRYAVACGGILLLTISSVFTFFYLMGHERAVVSPGNPIREIAITHQVSNESSEAIGALTNAISIVQENMPLILSLWVAGFLFFVFRLAGGLFYTRKLQSEAQPLENEWNEFIARAGQTLGIDRLVSLAESVAITTPMVIGYLKPVILIPAGMLTGLSGEQLETIFLHELAHIRRHDYVVNLLQSIIEAVFFFNPFAWSLSNAIRREREYCCDDLVIRQHGSARIYAHALAQLAEIKHSTPRFAIALAGERNQLLNRIRRIMEKSVKNNSGRNRILIPVILFVSGLLCMSWLGIQENNSRQSDPMLAEQDTIIPDRENGLRPLMKKGLPPIPDISAFTPPYAVLPDPALPRLGVAPDTIPPPSMDFQNPEQWKEFSKAFENFRMDFDELFSLRNGDALRFMEEFEQRFRMEDWDDSTRFNFRFPREAFENLRNLPDKEWFGELEEELKRLEGLNLEQLKRFEREFKADSVGSQGGLLDNLRDELINDGYLSKDESIQSLEWTDEVFKVNGQAIKDSDEKKYRDLFDQGSNRRPLQRLE